jgi:DNA-binding Lrp family transcriptional regulator
MAVRGYVLIETEVGSAKAVSAYISDFTYPGARVASVDTVTGPYDVIVQLEADDLDHLGNALTEAVQKISGVQRTTTCLAVRLH